MCACAAGQLNSAKAWPPRMVGPPFECTVAKQGTAEWCVHAPGGRPARRPSLMMTGDFMTNRATQEAGVDLISQHH